MVMFRSFGDCAGKSVLDCLQAFDLRRVDVVKDGITVVEFGMNNRRPNRNLQISKAPLERQAQGTSLFTSAIDVAIVHAVLNEDY